MASTFAVNKTNLQEPATGDLPSAWGPVLNANATDIDNCLGGEIQASLAGGNVTLSKAQVQCMTIVFTGAITGDRWVYLPASVGGSWIVYNGTTGAHNVLVASTSGAPTYVLCAQGRSTQLWTDGANVFLADNGPYLNRAGDTMTGGLTLPVNGLTVGGNELVVTTAGISTSGNVYATGDVVAFSDRRLKHDIRPIENALTLVQKLHGVRYKTAQEDERIGMIAQDVEVHVPEVVRDYDGTYALAYDKLVALLIEAVKELNDKVERLSK
jgi:hypothetical protein